jgi:hypothetical protein
VGGRSDGGVGGFGVTRCEPEPNHCLQNGNGGGGNCTPGDSGSSGSTLAGGNGGSGSWGGGGGGPCNHAGIHTGFYGGGGGGSTCAEASAINVTYDLGVQAGDGRIVISWYRNSKCLETAILGRRTSRIPVGEALRRGDHARKPDTPED